MSWGWRDTPSEAGVAIRTSMPLSAEEASSAETSNGMTVTPRAMSFLLRSLSLDSCRTRVDEKI
jgi:hypothetical protein